MLIWQMQKKKRNLVQFVPQESYYEYDGSLEEVIYQEEYDKKLCFHQFRN